MVCVFARETSEPLTSLVKQIDEKVGESGRLKSFVVLLADDAEPAAEKLKELAEEAGIRDVPLTVFGSATGPLDYVIARDADVTVLMWEGHEVKANHAYKGELTDEEIGAIMADLPKILGN